MAMLQPSIRQEARKARTRNKILDAARTLFAENGYNATTIDRITLHAGVGRGTFYMHFVGKAELIEAMYLEFLDAFQPLLRMMPDYTSDERRLCIWIEKYIAFLVSQKAASRAISAATRTGVATFLERSRWHMLSLEAFGARLPAFRIAAEGRDPVITAQAQLLLFQLTGFTMACAQEDWTAGRDATILEMARSFLAFIRRNEEQQPRPALQVASGGHL